jgi:cardiolipin synthase
VPPLNLPNILTLFRFALIPVYILVFSYGYLEFSFGIVILAGLTDILDGYLARKNGQVTQIGVMLDPLADKTMMIVVILSLLYKGYISWQAALAIFLRDAGMIIGSAFFHLRGKKTVPANMMGKLTTVLYYIAIMFIFFRAPFAETYLWCVIVISFITSWIYVLKFRTINQN